MLSRTSRMLLALCAVGSLSIMGGCSFLVLFPLPLQTSSEDFEVSDDKLKITVTFSDEVNLDSLLPRINVILVTELDANADITIAPGTTAFDIVITSVDDYDDLLTLDPDGVFTLRLLGSDPHSVTNTAGEILDGDADGYAGGNYETTFVLNE